MVRQLELFLHALQFLTRIPTPTLARYQPDWTTRSARYFPLVGQVVGGICALVLLAASQVLGGWLPALLAVSAGILITGGFHEDGLADTADGLGGGQTVARRLEIMKDSRLGTYGALVLILSLAARVGAIAALPPTMGALALLAAHGLGRAATVPAMAIMPYGGDPKATQKGAPLKAAPIDVVLALIFSLWPLLLLPMAAGLTACLVGAMAAAVPALSAWRLIRGRTGDVLGAVEQMFEVGFLLACAALLAK
jgi:adenosylcobinamide-GDP ribazoletransferase